jgi:ankyrin repeat protein
MDTHYYPSQRDRRFCDLPIDIATIMNTGDIDELCEALKTQPRHVADTALFRAAQFNQAFFIKPLVERCGADVNAVDPRNNETALHTAANQRCVETVTALLDAGVAYGKKNTNGDTALMVAIHQLVWQNLPGRAEATIKAMMDKAGYVHSRAAWSEETPLTFAVAQGNENVVKQLLAAGAPVNSPARVPFYSREGDAPTGFWSPLHAAALKGDKEMVSLLLAAGADPNGRDKKGRTPLHYASADEVYLSGCYELLVDGGADKRAYDSDGKFPR